MIRKMFALASVAMLSLPTLALAAGDRPFATAPTNTEYCIDKVDGIKANKDSIQGKASKNACRADMNGFADREVALGGRDGHEGRTAGSRSNGFSGSVNSVKGFN